MTKTNIDPSEYCFECHDFQCKHKEDIGCLRSPEPDGLLDSPKIANISEDNENLEKEDSIIGKSTLCSQESNDCLELRRSSPQKHMLSLLDRKLQENTSGRKTPELQELNLNTVQ